MYITCPKPLPRSLPLWVFVFDTALSISSGYGESYIGSFLLVVRWILAQSVIPTLIKIAGVRFGNEFLVVGRKIVVILNMIY